MITIPIYNLSQRRNSIVTLLRPLVDTESVRTIPTEIILTKKNKIIIAFDGKKISDDFQDWKFQSFAREIWCQYYEIWKPSMDQQSLFLERAYLNMFRTDKDKREHKPFLCVHCDPEEKTNEYKRGPHLHVQMASEPIPRCHFPLNYGHIEIVMETIESLTAAIGSAVVMLKKEVVSNCEV